MNIYRWNTSKITRIPSMGTIRRSVVSFKCRPLYHWTRPWGTQWMREAAGQYSVQ